MKKAVWISFFVSLVLVNLIAWLVEYFTGFYIVMIFRVTLILGISAITAIFAGSYLLISKFEQEKPLTGTDEHSLQPRPDTSQSEKP